MLLSYSTPFQFRTKSSRGNLEIYFILDGVSGKKKYFEKKLTTVSVIFVQFVLAVVMSLLTQQTWIFLMINNFFKPIFFWLWMIEKFYGVAALVKQNLLIWSLFLWQTLFWMPKNNVPSKSVFHCQNRSEILFGNIHYGLNKLCKTFVFWKLIGFQNCSL